MNRHIRAQHPFEPEKLAGGPGFPKAFPALDRPRYVPASEATQVRLDDEVIGLVHDGKARAYPTWAARIFHIVNDASSAQPLLVDT